MFPMMYGDHDLKKSSHVRWGRWTFNKVLKKRKSKKKKEFDLRPRPMFDELHGL